MPSSSKRKHQSYPLHSSNDDHLSQHAERAKHTAHGKENLASSQILGIARTSSDGPPAENSCHEEPLNLAENVYLPRASLPPCFQHGQTLVSIEKCANGTSFGCSSLYSGPSRHQKPSSEVICKLEELHKHLLQQVRSLKCDESLLHFRLKGLQAELETNSARQHALLAEKIWFEDQKTHLETAVKSAKLELANLGLEKSSLLDDKMHLVASNNDLQRSLLDSECKLKETSEKLQESVVVLGRVNDKVDPLNDGIHEAHLQQHKLEDGISSAHLQHFGISWATRDLQISISSLNHELSMIKDAYQVSATRFVEANRQREALQADLSNAFFVREGFQMQLKEAWHQIRSLEAQEEARIRERFNMQKQVQQLENKLASTCDERDKAACIFDQEREEKKCLKTFLVTTEETSKGYEVEIDSMGSATAILQAKSVKMLQRISSLEAQVTCSIVAKSALVEMNASLTEKVEQLKSSSAEALEISENELLVLGETASKLEKGLEIVHRHVHDADKAVRSLGSEVKDLSASLKMSNVLAEITLPLAVVSTGSLLILSSILVFRRWH